MDCAIESMLDSALSAPLCRFCFASWHMILERFFHFFGSKFSEYPNAIVINIDELNSFDVKASRGVCNDFIDKFVY